MTRILVLDNYDSFTWNIVGALAQLGATCEVARSDRADVDVDAFDAILLGPGPCTPRDAGMSLEVARTARRPILGVCLGHQVVAEAFGGHVRRAREAIHGKTELIQHDGRGIFEDMPRPFRAARYNSLSVDERTLPVELEVSARSADGEIMAMRHTTRPIETVQFHPESWLSEGGETLFRSWLTSLSRVDLAHCFAVERRGAP